MKDRTTLALEACQGLSDKELAKRGPAAFSKMIERKRLYAAAARMLKAAHDQKEIELQKLGLQVKILTTQVQAMEALDAKIENTQQAANLLANFSKKN